MPLEERNHSPEVELFSIKSAAYRIYPNPNNSNSLTVSGPQPSERIDLSIRDLHGRLIFQAKELDMHEPIPIQNIPAGIYWINICTTSDELHLEKLVILK